MDVLHLNARVYLLKMLSKLCNFFISQYMIRIYNSKYIIFDRILPALKTNLNKILEEKFQTSLFINLITDIWSNLLLIPLLGLAASVINANL